MKLKHELIMIQLAVGKFSDMCNPLNRGINFKWNSCASMIANQVDADFPFYFNEHPNHDSNELKEYVKTFVGSWIERAGFKDE